MHRSIERCGNIPARVEVAEVRVRVVVVDRVDRLNKQIVIAQVIVFE